MMITAETLKKLGFTDMQVGRFAIRLKTGAMLIYVLETGQIYCHGTHLITATSEEFLREVLETLQAEPAV